MSPQSENNTFYDGTVDALKFMLSTPEVPYCLAPACSGDSHCEKLTRRAAGGLNAACNPFWASVNAKRIGMAGHIYGAHGVSYVGQQDPLRHIEKAIGQVQKQGQHRIEVTAEAEADYPNMIHSEVQKTVWHHGGYMSRYQSRGRHEVAMFSGFSFTYQRMAGDFQLAQYQLA